MSGFTPETVAAGWMVRVDEPMCSAKACRAVATHVVVWNNPKVHTPDREKLWHACDEHRQSLSDYLDLRGFLIRVEPC
jgi:hypothetical protein